jgi:GDP-4-dehydro-6-deoxy-D-mannose reductase
VRKNVECGPQLTSNVKRFLVTGIAGFAGRHLAELLLARGDEVHGMVRGREDRPQLRTLGGLRPEAIHVADVLDAAAVERVVAAVAPDGILHLAGVSFVPDAVADPFAAFRINVLGALHVFAAVQRQQPACRVLAVGSSDAYGAVAAEELPIRESCPFRPLTPYGASKAALDLLAYQWAHGAGLDVVAVRPFNHTGPGQRPDFVCPDFARQLVAVARRERPPVLSVGDLEVVRDFSDVRDVVAAYVAVWERGARGSAYNVCSGVGRSVRSVLETLIELVGVDVRIEVTPARMRGATVPALVGSADALRAATGWEPRIAWAETLAAVVEDARRNAARR